MVSVEKVDLLVHKDHLDHLVLLDREVRQVSLDLLDPQDKMARPDSQDLEERQVLLVPQVLLVHEEQLARKETQEKPVLQDLQVS